VGFIEEGRLRQQAWFEGAYADALVMGLLREEWNEAED
jgi:RimJ/RimL family protein N-acetyltransferase